MSRKNQKRFKRWLSEAWRRRFFRGGGSELKRCRSREQIGAGRRELHVGSGVMHFQPAPCDGEIQAGAVFRGRAPVDEQKGAVEFLE
jgi:hypothetical protein